MLKLIKTTIRIAKRYDFEIILKDKKSGELITYREMCKILKDKKR